MTSMPLPPLIFLINVDWFFCSHFVHLARRAHAMGWPVVIATHVGRERERLAEAGYRLVELPSRRSGLLPSGLGGAVRVVARLLADNPGAVLHGFGLFGIATGALAGRMAGSRRAVFTITGRGFSAIDDGFAARAVRHATRALCRGFADGPSTRWLAENQADLVACGLIRATAQGRTAIVGGAGVDPEAFPFLPMPPRGPLRCALVARAIWSKGIDVAVEAIGRARAAGMAAELTIAGATDPVNPRSFSDGEMRAFASRPGIRWLGRVDDVPGLWRDHHVALLPSRGGEGVPKSLIEAAACGRPPITTDVPGCRELARDTCGWSVPPGDVAALSRAITEASQAPDLETRGQAARRAVLAGYTEEANWQRTLAWYRELAGQR